MLYVQFISDDFMTSANVRVSLRVHLANNVGDLGAYNVVYYSLRSFLYVQSIRHFINDRSMTSAVSISLPLATGTVREENPSRRRFVCSIVRVDIDLKTGKTSFR